MNAASGQGGKAMGFTRAQPIQRSEQLNHYNFLEFRIAGPGGLTLRSVRPLGKSAISLSSLFHKNHFKPRQAKLLIPLFISEFQK
jgi:hypothetical protein